MTDYQSRLMVGIQIVCTLKALYEQRFGESNSALFWLVLGWIVPELYSSVMFMLYGFPGLQ